MRLALRSLARSPGFTAVALLTLALGIGVNTSMFSVLNALLLRPPAYPDLPSLVRLQRTGIRLGTGYDSGPSSVANFLNLSAQARAFSHLAAGAPAFYNLADPGQAAERIVGENVSGAFFDVLGVQPALGRVFGPDEDHPGRNAVIVLSDALWRRRFAADPGVIGRRIRVDGDVVTVLGVMPPGFDDRRLWGSVVAWRPIAFSDDLRANRTNVWLTLIARLRPGVTTAQAQEEMSALAAALARDHPATDAGAGLSVAPLAHSGDDPTTRLLSFFASGLAACVLLIACANLANLQFARHAARARELAVRAALGASRFRLIRQSLAESLLLSFAGGAIGLLLAAWCNDLLGARLGLAGETGFALPLDSRVLAFTFTATLLAAAIFGTLPALVASRIDLNDALKRGARGTASGASPRLRQALIVAEVSLALVLLAASGFFLRGLDRLVQRDPGWRTGGVLTATLSLTAAKYPTDAAKAAFYDRLHDRLAALPGVERVALSRTLPFDGFFWSQRFLIEGRPVPRPGSEPTADLNGVSPDYFATLGLPLIEGRAFEPADLHGPVRTIISQSMARSLWPNESAIGHRLAHPVRREWQEIIGVVGDVSLATQLARPANVFQTYRLLAREPDADLSLALRCSAPPESLVDAVRRAVAELDPDQPVQEIRPAARVIASGLSNYATLAGLLAGFAALGLLLAAVGIYGVIAGYVVQRTSEIGLRVALGAQVRDILRLVLRQGLRLTLLGLALGLIGALVVARVLGAIAPALPAAEPVTAVAVTLLLFAVTLLASWLPARRATKVDPITALRAE